jgi:hypothetical protein
MSFCPGITDTGVTAIATGLIHLQSLDIEVFPNISYAGLTARLKAIATGLSHLQSLNISGCYNITDAGVMDIVTGLRHLVYLSVDHRCITTHNAKKIVKGISSSLILNCNQ